MKTDKTQNPKEPELPVAKQVKEAPAMDPHSGDKTPAYVAWFKENHTAEEFAAKYGNRHIPEV